MEGEINACVLDARLIVRGRIVASLKSRAKSRQEDSFRRRAWIRHRKKDKLFVAKRNGGRGREGRLVESAPSAAGQRVPSRARKVTPLRFLCCPPSLVPVFPLLFLLFEATSSGRDGTATKQGFDGQIRGLMGRLMKEM